VNRDQAYTLVRQTFTDAFDKNRFSYFSQNLLNHIDQSKAASWNSQYVKDAFKGHVQRYERLGTYTSPGREKLDVLIVYLTKESKLERTRTAIRNFVADHLKTREHSWHSFPPRKPRGVSLTSKWNTPPSKKTPAKSA
jgi:hypothetical protein